MISPWPNNKETCLAVCLAASCARELPSWSHAEITPTKTWSKERWEGTPSNLSKTWREAYCSRISKALPQVMVGIMWINKLLVTDMKLGTLHNPLAVTDQSHTASLHFKTVDPKMEKTLNRTHNCEHLCTVGSLVKTNHRRGICVEPCRAKVESTRTACKSGVRQRRVKRATVKVDHIREMLQHRTINNRQCLHQESSSSMAPRRLGQKSKAGKSRNGKPVIFRLHRKLRTLFWTGRPTVALEHVDWFFSSLPTPRAHIRIPQACRTQTISCTSTATKDLPQLSSKGIKPRSRRNKVRKFRKQTTPSQLGCSEQPGTSMKVQVQVLQAMGVLATMDTLHNSETKRSANLMQKWRTVLIEGYGNIKRAIPSPRHFRGRRPTKKGTKIAQDHQGTKPSTGRRIAECFPRITEQRTLEDCTPKIYQGLVDTGWSRIKSMLLEANRH